MNQRIQNAESANASLLITYLEPLNNRHSEITLQVHIIQWIPSNLATLGTNQSVLIRGVASFQGVQIRGSSL